ncbi:metallophosphoesterase family protein [Sphingobacterium chuzhouense]|uniref:Metallophosphoesterase n=1 Tax=Sphingobacterium chuzhouense TaxID=1742264 RepID=A0ABR7XLV4_9SPHI|nr:metallophosphoesterase family protein [Sphingobacterium chuzhouense]MBD1420126.1 metallophosphoesterase [Sphingobacterium chuzhouense]
MKRKEFLQQVSLGLGSIVLSGGLLSCSKGKENGPDENPIEGNPIKTDGTLRIGVITDVHKDYFPYADEYLEKFITAATAANVDFIIQIGDFTYPHFRNDGFLSIWNSFDGLKYHVLGNHDMDTSSKADFLNYVDQRDLGAHYSFDANGFHIVVLDTNFIKQGNSYTPYNARNYASHPNNEIGFVSPEQLEWLKNDLAKADKPTVLFSHQHLNGSAGNSQEIQTIIREENKKGKKVIASFSGHNHQNWLVEVDKVSHIQINSSSYFYVGPNFPDVTGRFPENVENNYSVMKKSAPYDDSLFAIVDFKGPERIIQIEGRESNFIAPSPYDLGYYTYRDQMSPSSNINNRTIKF